MPNPLTPENSAVTGDLLHGKLIHPHRQPPLMHQIPSQTHGKPPHGMQFRFDVGAECGFPEFGVES